jgi:alkanesulfonate monooxygenase SsuD/methylene tetrahydromethanopterin reductase-like flavin-dependent oxidoreductase (luciferase family)
MTRPDAMAWHGEAVSFGIKTVPQGGATYDAIRRLWREADDLPEIEHAWLWDHLQPLGLPADGPCLECWTLLAALAPQTSRLRIGLLVGSVLNHPPAVLAKMAATLDLISGGRLIVGLGAGWATDEQLAYGVPHLPPGERIDRLAEACRIIRRLWTEDVVDFDGRFFHLEGAHLEPKPVQRPHPPILIGGAGERRTLRVVAEQADIWNMPARDTRGADEFARLNRVLDDHCAAVGRDPAAIARSVQLFVDFTDLAGTRALGAAFIEAGADIVVLNLRPPYEAGMAARLVDEVIGPIGARSHA